MTRRWWGMLTGVLTVPGRGPGAGGGMDARQHVVLPPGRRQSVSAAPFLALALLVPTLAAAEPRTFRVAPPAEGSKAEAFVVYSLGTHTQTAQEIRGEVTLDPATLASGSGWVVVPIAAIRGDGGTRDCHMREALGLDYGAGGRFPKEHVCDGQDRLPASGSESVAFPDIRLEVLGARPLDDVALLESRKPVRVELDVRWTLHGVTHPGKELVRVLRDGTGLRARGRSTVVLADHGVLVRPTKVLFAEIKVGDAVTVTFDLRLIPVSP
ncbi:MAG TPA: YceI family protein [Myxococcaceae bacterium]|nr:YceI family protein [Myxococcaceae bacterium]